MRGINEWQGVLEGAILVSQQCHRYGSLGIDDRVAYGTVAVDTSFAKIAAFDTHPSSVVVLVKETIDHWDVLPFSVGGKLHLASFEKEKSQRREKK